MARREIGMFHEFLFTEVKICPKLIVFGGRLMVFAERIFVHFYKYTYIKSVEDNNNIVGNARIFQMDGRRDSAFYSHDRKAKLPL